MELNKVNISQINYEPITNLCFHNIARAIIDGHISDITLEGTVNVNKVRKDEVEAIASEINGIENLKFNDELYPGLTNFKVFPYDYYITFEDENVELLLIQNVNLLNTTYDGVGFDILSLGKITSIPSSIFNGNKTIKKFNELKYTNVTSLPETFKNSSIEEVSLPDSLTTINETFEFSNLKKINLNNVKILSGQSTDGEGAGFGNLPELEKVYVKQYRTIGGSYGAIRNLPKLKYVMVPTVEDYVKSNPTSGVNYDSHFIYSSKCIYTGTVDDFNNDRFDDEHLVTEIDLSSPEYDGMYKICAGVFLNNEKLINVNLNGIIEEIGTNAFRGCVNLKTLSGLENVTTLGDGAFRSCSANPLTSLDTTKIKNCGGVNVFTRNTGITSINIPYGFFKSNEYGSATISSYSWEDAAFLACTSLTRAEVDIKSTTMFPRCFQGCTSLRNVTFLNKDLSLINKINGCFSGCTNLISVDCTGLIKNTTTSTNAMFQNCSNITELDFTGCDFSGLTDCGNMFQGCSKLLKITLPSLPKALNTQYMFSGNNSLSEIYFTGKIYRSLLIQTNVFSDESLYNILNALEETDNDKANSVVTLGTTAVNKMRVLYPDLYNQKVAAGWTFK